jgi:hypothetical protein
VHNPYDEFNTVTSIHPDFYLKKVKAYTDKLVYIPYFVLDDIEPDNQEAIDKISHFCFLPGTMYADYVIVQSEKIRQVYINEYCKAAKDHFLPVERAQVEQRFLGLGSPKYEKVLNTKKEELEIPPEWLSMMQQPDGTPKRIIFYNITLAPFLQNSEQMLKKINEVFQVFRDSREKVALLWRPHPLMQQTIASMRPALQQTYDHLVQQYRTEGWGIYDDTPDLNRAIALSDAYYGDESSVIFLYEKTGKPILKHLIENDTHEIREILMSDGRVGEEVTLKEYIDMVVEGTLGKTQVSIREQRVGKSIWETLKKL